MPKPLNFGFFSFWLTRKLLLLSILGTSFVVGQELPSVLLPTQSPPPQISQSVTPLESSLSVNNPNLSVLLEAIRKNARNGNLQEAQQLATEALSSLQQSEENEFYLNQIKAEETKLYFKLANEAMLSKRYALASQYIQKYRENVAAELSVRKVRQNLSTEIRESKNVSLVGKLVEELDQAKKDLAQIRAKTGLPEDDAKPDLDRLVEEEKSKINLRKRSAENLLRKAQNDSSQGRYQLAEEQLDDALNQLQASTATIALISDIYKAKQQVVWFKVGEAMLKGKVGEVQELVLTYKEIEDARRRVETETLGEVNEIDFDAEIKMANEKNSQQAKFAADMLEEAKKLIKEKDYDTAEKILHKIANFLEPNTLTWPIILEASLVRNRINLAKADDSREEKDWDKAQSFIDEFRTGFYQDRNIQGDTLTFGRPGLEKTFGEGAVEDELELAEKGKSRITKDKMDPFKRDITEFTPDWKERQELLQELLMRAKVQFINGDLTGATETYRTIETRYSDNFEAKEMLRRISGMRQTESYLGYIKTRQEMLEEIEREWERPKVFDRQIEAAKEVEEGPGTTENKLRLIEIPGVNFFNSTLSEAVAELQMQARQFDLTEPDVTKKGLNILPLLKGEEEPTVTITLQSMSLGDMLDYITEMIGWTYDIRDDAVVIQKSGGAFRGGGSLSTEFYELSQGTIDVMTESFSDGGGDIDPFADNGGDDFGGGDTGIKIKAFLENAGIKFEEDKGHVFSFSNPNLMIKHKRSSLDLIERILAKLDEDSSRQVEIETKFLEVQEGALDEISFDWQYSWGPANPIYDITKTQSGQNLFTERVDNFSRPVFAYDNSISGNTRTLSSAHSPTGSDRTTRVISGNAGTEDVTIANPLPNLPGKIAIGTGVSPLWSLNQSTGDYTTQDGNGMIIGTSQARLLINALKRKQGTDLLSAPRVTVLNGKTARITVAQEFIYPTGYQAAEPPQAPAAGGAAGGTTNAGTTIQAPTPEFDNVANPEDGTPGFREVGVVLEVTPNIEKYNSINLELKPQVTEFDGFIDYGGTTAAIGSVGNSGDAPMVIQPNGVLMPIFSVRKVQTEVSIFDGATVIIGGLTREEVKTVNDKIPVLGNLPLIGKLFQTNAESYSKRNLLIFVSASIVSRGGSPVRETIQSISPQSIFKDPVIMTPTGTIRRSFKDEGIEEE
jgi:general secretion pathway protein D